MHGVDHRVCVLERDEDAVGIHHLGGAGDRRELIDRELDGLLAADLQIPFVVGEHEPPAEQRLMMKASVIPFA